MAHDGTTPRRIGRYELLEEVGHGGMSVVYRALDTNLEREVALKLLHPHLATHVESRKRFQREARAVARLKHPAVLDIYDFSDADGDEVYIAMEIVEGKTLRSFLDEQRGEPLSAEATALLLREVVAALAHAHANGVVHRDVKPENILIGPDGETKISDFGIAHLVGLSQMTATGQILGSPAYMSPEHIEQAELDARADIFSIGTVLYEMAVGHVPFQGRNPHAVIKRIVEGDYDDPMGINPAVGYLMARIIRRCLEQDPERRYESTGMLVEDLDDVLALADLGPLPEERRSFLDDRERWQEKLRPRVIAKTLELGAAARRERRIPEAADHFNRVLALEPGNERALAAVAGLSRQRIARRLAERAAVAVALLVVIGALGWSAFRGEAEGQPQAGPKEPLAKIPVPDAGTPAAKVPKKTADAGPVFATGVRAPLTPVARPASQRARRARTVVFTPQPMAVEIVIDGKKRFPFGPATRKQEILTGRHTITFVPNDPRRFQEQTWKVNIPPGDAPFQFRERLRWKPARLHVESVDGAAVTVPGRAAAKANASFEVAIKKGPSEKISVLVSREGYKPRTKQVTIAAGETMRTKVPLSRSAEEPGSP